MRRRPSLGSRRSSARSGLFVSVRRTVSLTEPRAGSRSRTWRRARAVAVLVSFVAALTLPHLASAHILHSDGSWTYRTVNDQLNFDDQESHGSYLNTVRAHFRIWYAPHGHSSVVDKWSTIDAHHERVALCTCIHKIDEDWETWEYHVASEMAPAHNFYYDYWARQGPQYLQHQASCKSRTNR
jgi:hypothetical protein